MTRQVCAWCGKELRATDGDLISGKVSHGICDDCALTLLPTAQRTALDILEGLQEPVFLVDGDARVHAATARARSFVGKESPEIARKLAGDVIECVHASEPGGCGGTIHCKACTIRNSVTETIASGRPIRRVSAFQDIRMESGVVRKHLMVSAERAGKFVLLSLEEDAAAGFANVEP